MMMWIVLPDGRAARHPIDGYYFAGDKAFVGRLPTSDLVLEQFANGSRIELTTAQGNTLFAAPMKGTGKLRGEIRQACGI